MRNVKSVTLMNPIIQQTEKSRCLYRTYSIQKYHQQYEVELKAIMMSFQYQMMDS